MKILIVSGGNIQTGFALDFLKNRRFDKVIAVDKGAVFCREAGIVPSVLVGDFDTLDGETLAWYEEQGIPVRRFRPEKDAADIEIALEMAKEWLGSAPDGGDITLLGGTGTRLDHVFGTLYCMAGLGADVSCELVDANNRIRMLYPGTYSLKKAECFGKYVSLFPIGGDASGITLRGFKYPLTEYTMTCSNSLGVSNELMAEEGMIVLREGLLACFETRD